MFREISIEIVQVAAGQAKFLQPRIPNSRRPPFHLTDVFEPLEKFQAKKDISNPKIHFHFSEEVIPVAVTNMIGPEITLIKNTTLHCLEVLPDDELNKFTPAQGSRKNATLKQKSHFPAKNETRKTTWKR